ncbi:hypothetical protein AALO_G00059640 [Alosa alosa]|uniref:Uncharacterized protein n=1 Tax=Alosa alosa TaxID=278164 RepID=A0AAV6H608_9TELE|nr:hypothetical protein AALO_G00059640 [Alosa alosa]
MRPGHLILWGPSLQDAFPKVQEGRVQGETHQNRDNIPVCGRLDGLHHGRGLWTKKHTGRNS